MRKAISMFVIVALAMSLSALKQVARAQSVTDKTIPVTVDNFIRAESDLYFGAVAVKEGGFGKFFHNREVSPIDRQNVVRQNRDTLYSAAVFDLDAGPVTVTLPDAGKRFMSMQVISEDHYVPAVFYGAGSHTLTREQIGARYVAVAIRTPGRSREPEGYRRGSRLSRMRSKLVRRAPGSSKSPTGIRCQKKVRDALLVLGSTLPDFKRAFGTKEQVDPIRHLVASAAAWGGNPDKDATYLNITPAKNDSAIVYRLGIKDVPVDSFWSVSVYNADGYFQKNPYDAYTLNNITAKKSADGSVAIQFGGCDGNVLNCLPIEPGWNYTVRLYRPRAQILNDVWTFPQAYPVN